MTRPDEAATCVNDWCGRPRRTSGYCVVCYQRGYRAGDMARAAMRPYQVWTTAYADVDEAAVERLVSGDPPERATVGERRVAIRRLHALGLSDGQIAKRIGCTVGTVWRARKQLGLSANRHGRVSLDEVDECRELLGESYAALFRDRDWERFADLVGQAIDAGGVEVVEALSRRGAP